MKMWAISLFCEIRKPELCLMRLPFIPRQTSLHFRLPSRKYRACCFPNRILAKELMGKDVSHLLVNQIISHHTGLHDFGDVENILKERLLSKEINEGDISINKPLLFQEFIDSPFSKSKVEWKHFHHLSRMLFSCLVDADRLDTERFMDVESWRKRGNSATLFSLQLGSDFPSAKSTRLPSSPARFGFFFAELLSPSLLFTCCVNDILAYID